MTAVFKTINEHLQLAANIRLEFLDAKKYVTQRLAIYNELLKANAETNQFSPQDYIQNLDNQIKRKERTGRDLIKDENELLATVFYDTGSTNRDGSLDIVWCNRNVRSAGIARSFVSMALSDMRDHGANEAETWVGEHNHAAQKFFRKCGWHNTGFVIGESADYRQFTYDLR